jgi:hypothetical protein
LKAPMVCPMPYKDSTQWAKDVPMVLPCAISRTEAVHLGQGSPSRAAAVRSRAYLDRAVSLAGMTSCSQCYAAGVKLLPIREPWFADQG